MEKDSFCCHFTKTLREKIERKLEKERKGRKKKKRKKEKKRIGKKISFSSLKFLISSTILKFLLLGLKKKKGGRGRGRFLKKQGGRILIFFIKN